MRNFILLIILTATLSSCKKSIPAPDVLKLKVYSTKIEKTNHNEPEILYWYLRIGKSGKTYYVTSTQRLLDFSEYTFQNTMGLPTDLENANKLEDIVVYIRCLNGEIATDI